MAKTRNLGNLSDFLTATGTNVTTTTPAQFDNSTGLATTGFVQRFGMQASALTSINGNTTLTVANLGGTVLGFSASAITATLPAVTSSPRGSRIEFFNVGVGNLTVARAGSDTLALNSAGGATSILIRNGDSLILESDGSSQWYGVGGTAQVPYSGMFAFSLGTYSYQRLPSGIIMQMGSTGGTSIAPGSSFAMTLPIAFSNGPLAAFATGVNGNSGVPEILGLSNTTITLGNPTTGSANTFYYWLAFGT